MTRENIELIKRIYEKQKEAASKGDWIKIIREDFEFIGEVLDEDIIKYTPKKRI